ncbi:MAG: hypothetical protein WEF50_19140 [Myxococcota bacterium]
MSRRWLALLASAALLPACANHVRYSSDAFETKAQEVVHVATVVEPAGPVLTSSGVDLEILADETAVVRKLRTRVRFDEYTPYKSGYELWEVPAGTVCLPILLVARIVDLVGFGMVPDESLDAFAGWTFSAMNPLLNTESGSRLRRNEVSRETEELDSRVRRELKPLAGAEVVLSLDARTSKTFASDARGRVRVELLALAPDALPGLPRSLRVAVEGEGEREREVFELPISRTLATQLVQAMASRRRATSRGATPERIGRSLAELDALGFPASALALERELRTRAGANTAWLSRLDAALRP